MPTYTFRCPVCGRVEDLTTSIARYSAPEFKPPVCMCPSVSANPTPMQRFFTPADPVRALDALTSDAIYDGCRTLDGVDVSTRSKHRAYMREHGLTTADDYRGEWAQAAQERAKVTEGIDPARRTDIERAIAQLVNR